MKLLIIDLEGTGYHIFIKIKSGGWFCLNGRTPVNLALVERYIVRWEDRVSEIIYRTDFYARIPVGI